MLDAFEESEERLPPPQQMEKAFDLSGFDGGRYEVSVSLDAPNDTKWQTLRIDGDKLPKNAVFRFRKAGDTIKSFGGSKSLKKFFNEKKIRASERAWLPLIAEKDRKEVFAVCGVEISERVKITEETQNVLYITLQKKENFQDGGSAP